MMTDYDLEAMAKVFRPAKKVNVMAGMGLKLIGEIELLRMQVRHAQVDGIKLAASVAEDYDRLSYHGYLVSDCILGKLNVLKRKPHKNPAAAKIRQALDSLERKVDGLGGTMRFMALAGKRTKAGKK
jgi:hypothetical protein